MPKFLYVLYRELIDKNNKIILTKHAKITHYDGNTQFFTLQTLKLKILRDIPGNDRIR